MTERPVYTFNQTARLKYEYMAVGYFYGVMDGTGAAWETFGKKLRAWEQFVSRWMDEHKSYQIAGQLENMFKTFQRESCPNPWHKSAPARKHEFCAECK